MVGNATGLCTDVTCVKKIIVTVTTFLLSVALAAMGLETDISKLYARGFRPAILGALAFLFVTKLMPETKGRSLEAITLQENGLADVAASAPPLIR